MTTALTLTAGMRILTEKIAFVHLLLSLVWEKGEIRWFFIRIFDKWCLSVEQVLKRWNTGQHHVSSIFRFYKMLSKNIKTILFLSCLALLLVHNTRGSKGTFQRKRITLAEYLYLRLHKLGRNRNRKQVDKLTIELWSYFLSCIFSFHRKKWISRILRITRVKIEWEVCWRTMTLILI